MVDLTAAARRIAIPALLLALTGALYVTAEDAPDPVGVGSPDIDIVLGEPLSPPQCVGAAPSDHAVVAEQSCGSVLPSGPVWAPDDPSRTPRVPRSPPVA